MRPPPLADPTPRTARNARVAMRIGVRQKLVLVSLVVLVGVSFGFTALNFRLARGGIEEDLKERAITFAREVAATIGDRREFESSELLQGQIHEILTIRRSVTQLAVLAFGADGTRVAAASQPDRRLPFPRQGVA